MTAPALVLDHVVIAVRDLDGAQETCGRLLGLAPSWRGSHPQYGTRNVLYRLTNTYVELLAPSAGEVKEGTFGYDLRRWVDERGEGLYAIALGTEDIGSTVLHLRQQGVDISEPADGEGEDELTGARRAWRNAFVPLAAARGVRCFFIQHLSPPDALPMARAAGPEKAVVHAVDHVVVMSSKLEASRHLWGDVMGIRLARERDFPERDSRLLFFRPGYVTLEFAGSISGQGDDTGDRLWGVAYEVEDVEAAVNQVASDGFDVSEVRVGRGEGTRVATVRKPTCGVPTLFIDKKGGPVAAGA